MKKQKYQIQTSTKNQFVLMDQALRDEQDKADIQKQDLQKEFAVQEKELHKDLLSFKHQQSEKTNSTFNRIENLQSSIGETEARSFNLRKELNDLIDNLMQSFC